MKNIIIVLLILIVPVCAYLFMSRNSADFMADAKEKNIPALMIFTSSMCMDCQKMKAVLKEVESEYDSKIDFVYINALDKDRKIKEYIKKYKVVLVPTLIFVDDNGNQINKVEGFIPKEQLISEIEEAING